MKIKTAAAIFAIQMALSVIFSGFCFSSKTFAQIAENKQENQSETVVEIEAQEGCPLLITLIGVNDSSANRQILTFNVQNVSNKPIRGYTILNGGLLTLISGKNFFEVGASNTSEFSVETGDTKSNQKLSLSVDYVEFADGSSWGADTKQESERIKGFNAGRKDAIKRLKQLIGNRDEAAITAVLKQEPIQVESLPSPDSKQTDKWQKGFQQGYRFVISLLQRMNQQNLKAISAKLDELEKLLN